MEKQITTGTEITFKKTKEIFELTQTENGFDVRQAKFSKNVQPEHWSFQELLDQYEAGKIAIEGFDDEKDASHIKAILSGYIHESVLKKYITENEILKADNEQLKAEIQKLNEAMLAIKETEEEQA